MSDLPELWRLLNFVLAVIATAAFFVRLLDDWDLLKPGRSMSGIGWHTPVGFWLLLLAAAAGSATSYVRHIELSPATPVITCALVLVLVGLRRTRRQ